MLKAKNLTKTYDNGYTAVSSANLEIPSGIILGLIGSNGAGKSTIIRMLTGVFLQSSGDVLYDDRPVYDNVEVKREIFYFPDELYFAGATVKDIGKFYSYFYPDFDKHFYEKLCDSFKLKKSQTIIACSKGMKRQVMMNAAIASGVKYIFLDEAFDGLDAVARQTYIKLFSELSHEKGTSVIVATHNIREIDNFCDRLCLLYKSNIIADTTPDELISKRTRASVVFEDDFDKQSFIDKHTTTYFSRNDKYTLTFNYSKQDTEVLLKQAALKSFEYISMTLEDAFVCELEESGYAIKNVDII